MPKQSPHLLRRLQVELVIGPDMPQRAVYGDIVRRGDQGMLEFVSLRAVVQCVVGRYHGNTHFSRQNEQLTVAPGVSVQKVLLEFYVHAVRAEPICILTQQVQRFVLPTLLHKPGRKAISSTGKQNRSPGMRGQVRRVQARLTAVMSIRQRE